MLSGYFCLLSTLDFVYVLCYTEYGGEGVCLFGYLLTGKELNMAISYQKLFRLLEEKGWTTYKIRKEKLIGQGTLTALKNGTGGLNSKTISRLCEVLDCQPGDLMEYIPSEEE